MKFSNSAPSNSPPPKSSSGGVDTLIGRQTEILGDVRFAGGLHVDGRVRGNLFAETDKGATLSITENGTVEGDVRVPNIVLNGAVTGDVYAAEKVSLGTKARVNGNVFYKLLEMQAGAQVNGQLVHESSAPVAALSHRPEELEFSVEPKNLDALRQAG